MRPRSSAAECARVVRTNLLFTGTGRDLRRIVVTSASPREGKTAVALNLAFTMAASDKKTLLIDSDLRKPRLHRVFGVKNVEGLSNLIVGTGVPEEVVLETDVPNLHFLPCGSIPPNPAELLQTDGFRRLLDHLSEHYHRLILDSPPVMAVADPMIMCTHMDGAVLVIRSGQSISDMVLRSIEALQNVQGRVLGAVLNSVDISKPAYGKYYYYYYRQGYSSSYHSDEEKGSEKVA